MKPRRTSWDKIERDIRKAEKAALKQELRREKSDQRRAAAAISKRNGAKLKSFDVVM